MQDRRLVIVAGKGGVGKTTTSSAIALEYAARGRRTLLVTVDPAKRLKDSLGVPVGPRATEVRPHLDAMMLDPGDVLREHLDERLPELNITEHPLFRYVTQAMPGLNELMAIGKLNDFRREGTYEAIVIDTAPTGHALSFLSVPKAMRELSSEKSILKWAIRGYQVWQKLQTAAKGMSNVFKKKDERAAPPPEIDFDAIFGDIRAEADKIQSFLNDPEHSGMVLVTLPEKLPVEETVELHHAVTQELGMTVDAIVVNKVQPDALGAQKERVDALRKDATWPATASGATGEDPKLYEALLDAAEFGEIRREMNLHYIDDLRSRIEVPLIEVPLFKRDVQGMDALDAFRAELFG